MLQEWEIGAGIAQHSSPQAATHNSERLSFGVCPPGQRKARSEACVLDRVSPGLPPQRPGPEKPPNLRSQRLWLIWEHEGCRPCLNPLRLERTRQVFYLTSAIILRKRTEPKWISASSGQRLPHSRWLASDWTLGQRQDQRSPPSEASKRTGVHRVLVSQRGQAPLRTVKARVGLQGGQAATRS